MTIGSLSAGAGFAVSSGDGDGDGDGDGCARTAAPVTAKKTSEIEKRAMDSR